VNFDPKKTIFLIDGSSFLYRAYYGMRPLHTTKGEPVHAVYSFCRMIQKLIDSFNPAYMSLVWDSKGPSTRHAMFEAYKATRQAPPSDLFEQKKHMVTFATLIGLHQEEKSGFEADDSMYAIAKEQSAQGKTVVLITADKDMGQALCLDNVYLYDAFKYQIMDKEYFQEKMGFPVERIVFYFALLGDSSDNIPGVHGIGKKGALDLVTQFTSLEDMYARLDEVVKPRTRAILQEYEKDAFLSRDLFLLQYYPTGIMTEHMLFNASHWRNAQPLFAELEFKSLLSELGETKERHVIMIEDKIAAIKKYQMKLVATVEDLDALILYLKNYTAYAVDTETDGIRPLQANLVGISVCAQEGIAYYIPCGHKTDEPQLSLAQVIAAFKPILQDEFTTKYLHNAKFDMLVLSAHGIELKGSVVDTLVAASLVAQEWQRINLKELSTFYFNEPMLTFEEMVKTPKLKDFSYVPLSLATLYSAFDSHQTLRLAKIVEQELNDQEMGALYYTIEMPLLHVLYDMEKRGICADFEMLASLCAQITTALERIQQEILALIGPDQQAINLNSPRQIEQLLFYTLNLPPQKKSGKGTVYSTDQEVLDTLAKLHPVPALIVKYRELFKLKSTYIDALPSYSDPRDKKIHTTFSQTRVATGRLSSYDPNLQNIPASGPGLAVRKVFKPTPGDMFISADYSQIELRVLAYLSQDANLLEAFRQGRDIHAETASRLFDVALGEVTHDQRQIGKRINFSILYGLTPYGLSKDLDISFSQAKEYIEKYFAQYPGVRQWMDGVVRQTVKLGYCITYWGRRRSIPAIYEKNRVLYDEAKRVAINTVAQGTAAEIVKQGMIQVAQKLKQSGIDAHIILQIHDELLVSVPQDKAEIVEKMVTDTLEHIVAWNVPLQVKTRRGFDWKEVSK
jgi:DNA polymerase I